MNYTQNYQLPQWESSDRILMEDFNEAMEKLEDGLSGLEAQKVQVLVGTYAGDGTTGRVIDFGQAVTLVIVQGKGWRSNSFNDIGFAAGEGCIAGISSGGNGFTHIGTGIQIESTYFNNAGSTYSYIALAQ